MIYVRGDMSSKILMKHDLPEDIEAPFTELNLQKCKWLLGATYRPPSKNHNYFFDNIDKGLGVYSTDENVALAGDFNVQVGGKLFDTFLFQHEFTSINKNILINSLKSFFKTETVFTGLSDFHKLVLSILRLHISRTKAKKI